MKSLSQIDPNTIIITPNRRLSAWLMAKYDQICIKDGKTSWVTPKILPYETWLTWHYQQTVNQGHCQKILLNKFQSDLIWQSALATSPLADIVLQHQQTAKLASEAFSLLQQWLLPLEHPAFQDSLDYQTFQELAKHYIEHLSSKQLIDHSQLYLEFEEIIINKTTSIAFFGFAEFTAEQQRFIQLLKSKNKTVIIDSLHHVDHAKIERLALKDLSDELSTMAHFCKQVFQDNPNQIIGCVIPNLNQLRDKVEATFKHIIPGKFNISAAKPLSTYPVIYTALRCLMLNKIDLDRETTSHLLKTPFIGSAETEFSARMQLDMFLSENNIQNVSLKYLKQLSEKNTPFFSQLLTTFEITSVKQPLSVWAKTFNQQLQRLGWPGERTLNSLEFQEVQRFYTVLDELCALEFIQTECYFQQAYTLLTQLCHQTLFQGETETQPIQILGSLEAAGLHFDKLWITGLNDQDWPALNAPNPFIPLRLQREKSLPHATANRTLQFYQILSTQLFHASAHITVSYAEQIDGIDYQASQLIQHFPEAKLDIEFDKLLLTTLPCEDYPGDGLPLENNTIKGGTGYFKSQAACPFQAYALFRLNAKIIPDTYFGLDAADRGVIVHKALELIWQTLQSSQHLKTKNETELQVLIELSVKQSLVPFKLSPVLQELELTRLKELLFDWLTREKTREDFKIKAIEKTEQTVINDLQFTTRADRIDEMNDGTQLVIDYKTKKVTVNDWLTERLSEPQLPIYALTDEVISNIAFAQIRRDELKLAKLDFADQPDWLEQKQIWQDQLNTLADEIKSGLAIVNPRDNSCCQHCDLHSLCRIHEVSFDE